MSNDIWVEIKVEDNCLWQLKGEIFEDKPTLEQMQKAVGGRIEYMPNVYLTPEIKDMIVNEEGLLHGLKDNYLANMQLESLAPRVVGDVLVRVDKSFITKEFWLKGEE